MLDTGQFNQVWEVRGQTHPSMLGMGLCCAKVLVIIVGGGGWMRLHKPQGEGNVCVSKVPPLFENLLYSSILLCYLVIICKSQRLKMVTTMS